MQLPFDFGTECNGTETNKIIHNATKEFKTTQQRNKTGQNQTNYIKMNQSRTNSHTIQITHNENKPNHTQRNKKTRKHTN